MKKGKKVAKLKLPMQFEEAVSDFLKVKPPANKPKTVKRKKVGSAKVSEARVS